MRNTTQRREAILQQLTRKGSVQVTDLVQEFGVSAVTIRNDLSALETQGLATRSHGGAPLTRTPPPGSPPFTWKIGPCTILATSGA